MCVWFIHQETVVIKDTDCGIWIEYGPHYLLAACPIFFKAVEIDLITNLISLKSCLIFILQSCLKFDNKILIRQGFLLFESVFYPKHLAHAWLGLGAPQNSVEQRKK